MLNDEEYAQFEQLVDGDYTTQVEDAGFEAALYGVKLALSVISAEAGVREHAIDYLFKFGNWGKMTLPHDVQRALDVRTFGEEEIAALEEEAEQEGM